MLLTAAAYIFNNAQEFNEITGALVVDYDGPYLALCTDEIESIMPWKVFCKYSENQSVILLANEFIGLLEQQRGFARLEISQILIAGGGTMSCCHKCGWTSKYAYAYMKLLEGKDLWPGALSRISISKALEKAEKMPDPIPEERNTQCQYAYKHESPAYREDRRWKLNTFKEKIGLCLRCTRLGRTDSSCNNPSHSR
jgi:hypothetical protein